MKIIKAVMGVRVSEKVEELGLDLSEHAEEEEYKIGDKVHKREKNEKTK